MRRSLCTALLGSVAPFVANAAAQSTRCATAAEVVDSARNDLFEFLRSDSPLMAELRTEHRIKIDSVTAVPITERMICTRLTPAFNHAIAPTTRFAVLKVGPLYYARDPDQKRGTGVLVDSLFRVVLRFGAELPTVAGRP
jgi:hypothetical protein